MHTNNQTLTQYEKKWNHCIKCKGLSPYAHIIWFVTHV